MEGRVILNVALEVYKAVVRDQGERCLDALAELGKFRLRKMPDREIGCPYFDGATGIKGIIGGFLVNRINDISFHHVSGYQSLGRELGQGVVDAGDGGVELAGEIGGVECISDGKATAQNVITNLLVDRLVSYHLKAPKLATEISKWSFTARLSRVNLGEKDCMRASLDIGRNAAFDTR